MKKIYLIKVDYPAQYGNPGGEGTVAYCENERTAKKAVKILNAENEDIGETYSYEEIYSIYDYMNMEEVK